VTNSEPTRDAQESESELSLRARNNPLALILDHMLNGVAYCQVIYEEGKATD